MILRSADASPFARKVRLAAAILGLNDQITIEAAAPMDPDDSLRTQNPLSKIPALILNDGRVLYDSRVIIEYLDTIADGKSVIPRETDARFEALTMAALADGILDASILIVYESRCRPDIEPYGLVRGWTFSAARSNADARHWPLHRRRWSQSPSPQ